MEKDFELETILSVITGISCTNNFDEVHKLFCYAFNDEFISPIGLGVLKDSLKEHILNIHPQLRKVYKYLLIHHVMLG